MATRALRASAFFMVAGAGLLGVTALSATAKAEMTWNIVGTADGQPDLIGVVTTPDIPASCGGTPSFCNVSGTVTIPDGALGGPGTTVDLGTVPENVSFDLTASPPTAGDNFVFNFSKDGYSCTEQATFRLFCYFEDNPGGSIDLALTSSSVAIGNGNVIITEQLWVAGKPVEPVTDTTCSVAECSADGVTTLTCGATEVEIACAVPTTTYAIGDTGPGGGIVFYVTDGGRHGLEAAPAPQVQDPMAQWCSTTSDIGGVYNVGSTFVPDGHSGVHNTPLIAAVCGATSAAGIAAAYVWPEGQMDGFLPNKEELDLIYRNLHVAGTGGFTSLYYWSSSEGDAPGGAWPQPFFDTDRLVNFKLNALRVRAVRAF